jgi:hypothetical protein
MTSLSTDDLMDIAVQLCGAAVESMEPCRVGGNNRVYRVETRSAIYAMKSYGAGELDLRDRLGHEFDGLRFLKNFEDDDAVPAAIAADRPHQCALYEWVNGTPVADHTARDIAAVLALVAKLHRARQAPNSSSIVNATESVLILGDLLAQIEQRLSRFTELETPEPELRSFIDFELKPEYERRAAALADRNLSIVLAREKRTLSPSDFGFHNAIRKADGALTFIDFEYFGWDDPVKLVSDFLWHPAMQLTLAERREFVHGTIELYEVDRDFVPRLSACFPLYGIRWCLIVLNEFLPKLWARRAFSGKGTDWSAAKREQLSKARAILAVVRSYEEGLLTA